MLPYAAELDPGLIRANKFLKSCWWAQTGLVPQAVIRRRRTVCRPKRLSSSAHSRIGRVFSAGMSDFNRSAHAVLKAATASGFFLMRWTGDFGPGPQFVMDNGMNAVIPQGDPQLRFDPALNLAVGSKA